MRNGQVIRNDKIDIAKALAIFMVVLGHEIQFVYCPDSFDDNVVFKIIYMFHMPLFMFLSGWCAYYKKTNISLVKKGKTLLYPFISWYIVNYFMLLLEKNDISFSVYIVKLIQNPDNGLWFLYVLFIEFVIYKMILCIHKKCGYSMLVLGFGLFIVMYTINSDYLGYKQIRWMWLFFFAGLLFHKYYIIDKMKKYIGLSIAVFSVCILYWSRIFDERSVFWSITQWKHLNEVLFLLVKIVAAVSGISFVLGIVNTSGFDTGKRFLLYIGQHTLAIYCIHFYLLSFWGFLNQSMCFSIVMCILIITMCLFIEYIVMHIPYIHVVLLGKR